MATRLACVASAALAAIILAAPALAQAVEVSPASRKALAISTAPVMEDTTISGASAFGTVVVPPGNAYSVASPFEAVLVQPLVIAGMQVEAGESVARLYSPDYETARAELETQRLTVEHMDHLAERAEELKALGLRSAQEADEAKHDAKSARLAYAASQGRLSGVRKTSGAGRFELLAPASGIVADISVEAGQSIGRSEPFLSIFDGERYWLEVALPERTARSIEIGTPVRLAGVSEPGDVIAIDPKVDPHLQSVRVRIALPESASWRLGQLVDVSFEAESETAALIVPSQALLRISGTDCVFVQTDTGFRRIDVTVVARNREQAVLHGDLRPGDEVAIAGLAALKNLFEGA